MGNIIRGLKEDGTLPSRALAQVRTEVQVGVGGIGTVPTPDGIRQIADEVVTDRVDVTASADTIPLRDGSGYVLGPTGSGTARRLPTNADVQDALSTALADFIEVDESVGKTITVGGQVLSYDSGLRDVSGDVMNGWTCTVYMRRTTHHVHWYLIGLDGSSATGDQILPSYTGFAPMRVDAVRVPHPSREHGSASTQWPEVTQSGQLHMAAAETARILGAAKITEDATTDLPTTLPGVPAE